MKHCISLLVVALLPAVGWCESASVKPASEKPPLASAPSVEASKPAADAGKPAADAGKPAADAGKPIADAAKPTAEAGKPTPAAAESAATTEKPDTICPSLDGLLGVKFGQTAAQVHAAVPGSEIQQSGEVSILPTELEGVSAGMLYHFDEDKMVSVMIVFMDPPGTTLEQRDKVYNEVGAKLQKRLARAHGLEGIPPSLIPQERCAPDRSECNRWWNDGNNLLVQRRTNEMHAIDFYITKVRDEFMRQAQQVGNHPQDNVPW